MGSKSPNKADGKLVHEKENKKKKEKKKAVELRGASAISHQEAVASATDTQPAKPLKYKKAKTAAPVAVAVAVGETHLGDNKSKNDKDKRERKREKKDKGKDSTADPVPQQPPIVAEADSSNPPKVRADHAGKMGKKRRKECTATLSEPAEDQQQVKKQKRGADGAEEGSAKQTRKAQTPKQTSAGAHMDNAENGNENGKANGAHKDPNSNNSKGSAAKAFQRVQAEQWLNQKGSWDNSYEGTFGQSGWGFKAQQVLGQVRGKDFRHEKTKKKRGSYKGGTIDPHASHSIKYDSDDD